MMTAMRDDVSFGAVQQDLANLKSDVGRLVVHLENSTLSEVRGAGDQISKGVHRLARSVETGRSRSVGAVSAWARAQPALVLLIAMGVGYLCGRATLR